MLAAIASGHPRVFMTSWRVEHAADTEVRTTMNGLFWGGTEDMGQRC